MKKPLSINCLFLLLILITGCSTGKPPVTELKQPQKMLIKDYKVEFEKIINTDFTASGTLRIEKKDNYLILFDGHVSSLKLACLDYTTGKEIWKASEPVWRYYFKDGALVMQYDNGIEMVEIASGKSMFKLNDCKIRWTHPEGNELADQICVVYKENDAVLDLKKMEIASNNLKARYASFTYQKTNLTKGGFVTEFDNIGKDFLTANVIEDEAGNQLIFIWSLNDSTRTFHLKIYNKTHQKIKEYHWGISPNKYAEDHDAYFTGLPEPEKLEPSTYVIENDLFIFENYTRYRWSWGQGNNRLTCINLKTLEMKYQIWGQGPTDKEFHTFLFFDDLILYSNNVMHFQMGDGIYNHFNKEDGKVLDSLEQRYTLFENYSPGVLLGFNYERKQIKGDEYTNKVSVTAWDHISNECSNSFQFDFADHFPYEPYVADDGRIIFTYYDDKLRKSVLYCCKVIPGMN